MVKFKTQPTGLFFASIAPLVSVQREVRAFRKSAAGGRIVERDRWTYIRFVRTEKEQGTVSDFLFGGAAGGGWYSVKFQITGVYRRLLLPVRKTRKRLCHIVHLSSALFFHCGSTAHVPA